MDRKRLSRRKFLGYAGAAAAGVFVHPARLFAQAGPVLQIKAEAARAPIVTHKLTDQVSVLEGSGGNIAVVHGPDGLLLIDAGIAVSKAKIEAALKAISPQAPTYLINTHWHFENTDGNEWVHAAGATVIAQENTRRHLTETIRVRDWDYTFPPAPVGALPADGELFSGERQVRLNGRNLHLRHYGAAHTDSDILVRFEHEDVIHVGDTWYNGVYPFIDSDTGGHIDGMIKAAHVNIALTNSKTIVIPGHGPVGNREGLSAYRDMLIATRDAVARLKKEGRTMEETVAARPTSAYDGSWGNGAVDAALYTRLVYKGV
jgi:glyoxylase-like metal-dependent hydrolase (beta-lactamase superfamily II)